MVIIATTNNDTWDTSTPSIAPDIISCIFPARNLYKPQPRENEEEKLLFFLIIFVHKLIREHGFQR
jgi:hypothetical protein